MSLPIKYPENNIVILPNCTVKNGIFQVNNLINHIGAPKLTLDKTQAALLYIELHKYLNDDTQ
jgi:hypothetical protein